LESIALGLLAPGRKRREALRAKPLRQPLKTLLTSRSAHYRRLPPEVRAEFDPQIQVFMAEKRVTAVETTLTVEDRLMVAASAVTLTAGWPRYTWEQLSEVLVYPRYFDRDYQFVTARDSEGGNADDFRPTDDLIAAGQAHPWGVVLLSMPALKESFGSGASDYHVGIHEFAHLLDLASSHFDGIPSYLSEEGVRTWARILEQERARLERGDSVLSPYGLSNDAELFAVAVEAFFGRPRLVAEAHRELYAFLAAYFNQDPAAWSDHPAAS
jgi:Mlc titration factor MtfA (ptsG expression regulator)